MMQPEVQMQDKAEEVAGFLKCFSSPVRLMIFCQLAEGEKTVTELVEFSGMAQTAISQHLKKLKDEGLIDFRRDHRTLHYYISDARAQAFMGSLHDLFCSEVK
jgi:ArsR family transcriptional regulator